MKKNMGNTDKIVRVLISIIIALLYFFNVIGGTAAYLLMASAIVLLITSFINYCPSYTLLGVNTCGVKK